MFRKSLVLIAFSLWLGTSLSAQTPLGTGFTYQGRLLQSGSPADGPFDLQFSLWDRVTSGTQVGSTITRNNVDVTTGLFMIQLNAGGEFGPGAFNGNARWLRVAVRPGASSGSYTALAPRQPINAVPYALQTRGIFTDGAGHVGIGTTNPAQPLEIANGRMRLSSDHGDIEFTDPADLIAYATTTLPPFDAPVFRVDVGTSLTRALTIINGAIWA